MIEERYTLIVGRCRAGVQTKTGAATRYQADLIGENGLIEQMVLVTLDDRMGRALLAQGKLPGRPTVEIIIRIPEPGEPPEL